MDFAWLYIIPNGIPILFQMVYGVVLQMSSYWLIAKLFPWTERFLCLICLVLAQTIIDGISCSVLVKNKLLKLHSTPNCCMETIFLHSSQDRTRKTQPDREIHCEHLHLVNNKTKKKKKKCALLIVSNLPENLPSGPGEKCYNWTLQDFTSPATFLWICLKFCGGKSSWSQLTHLHIHTPTGSHTWIQTDRHAPVPTHSASIFEHFHFLRESWHEAKT